MFHFQVTILDNGLSQDSFAFQNEFDLRLFFERMVHLKKAGPSSKSQNK
ncbi:MAG: hypothetical protein WCK42_06540 [Myxococcaceae bacterium]